ncbi:peroxidase [Chloroflexi bacterium TSY]|nr:peroxidase [Chloroflexi bacterium TSY]
MSHTKHAQHSVTIPHSQLYQGYFGRMFRKLPPAFATDRHFDQPGGLADKLAAQMSESAAEASDPSLDNLNVPAGYTYFGQFVDHDITFDTISRLDRQNDPNMLTNFRSPRFDLDNIYGRGPTDHPFMYDQGRKWRAADDGTYFLRIGKGADPREEDLFRNDQGVAIIGDPRNDENIIVSQIQLTFIKFHNCVMQALEAKNPQGGEKNYQEAQRIVRWHYQWVVINDFLRRIVGDVMLDNVAPTPDRPDRPRCHFYCWKNQPFMPLEFSGAAYRMGHSMVRSTYALSDKLEATRDSADLPKISGQIPIFLPQSEHLGDGFDHLRDLRGGLTKSALTPTEKKLPALWSVQWDRFLEINGSRPQWSRKIDEKLAFGLRAIPAGPGGENLLARLNLIRGWRYGLPSGQDVACAMGIDPINPDATDPLWYYILHEAGQTGDDYLGPVGGRVVTEVFYGLLAGDPSSYLTRCPTWTPWKERVLQIPRAYPDRFELSDIMKFAEMPINSADIDAILDRKVKSDE